MKSRSTLALLGSAALSLATLLPGTTQARTWTSVDGKPLQAIFLGIEGDNYKFKLQNGNQIQVHKDKFIKADQEAAERLAKIGDDSFTKASSRQIDTILAGTLKKNGFTSFNAPLPDDLFVRRVYLDIAGRIPTRQEFLRFAENARPDKREALIDELLLSPGYASHLFNYFADMYRINANDFDNGIRMDPYVHWWREQLKANRSYKDIVSDMILATGNVGQNPASGFLLRDTGMEFDAFANFGQVMLGIDISCAQCHDHPFDDWTQGDFYQMAAFFGNTQRSLGYRPADSMMGGGKIEMPNAPAGWRDNFMKWAETNKGIVPRDQNSNQFRFFVAALGWNVADNEALQTVLPHDFIGSGGKPGEVANPRVLLGSTAKLGGKKTRRQALADWLTAPENPRFALVIANRMWSRAFGRGILEPVNDFSDDSIKRSAQPDVLAYLAKEMVRTNYDLREFMRILYNTRAYQSIATAEEPDFSKSYYFQGPVLRRMRAEQAWDSMMVLAHGEEIDTKTGGDGSFYKKVLNVDFSTASNDDVWRHYEMWEALRGRGASMASAGEGGDTPILATDTELRASELTQPAPAASMLDTFGQSDRRVTDEHNYDGSVPQVLALMNGKVTRALTGTSSKIVSDLEELDGPDDKVRGVFFTLLNRFPDKEELDLGVGMMEDYGDDGISDLAWALMNSPEFLYIQ